MVDGYVEMELNEVTHKARIFLAHFRCRLSSKVELFILLSLSMSTSDPSVLILFKNTFEMRKKCVLMFVDILSYSSDIWVFETCKLGIL